MMSRTTHIRTLAALALFGCCTVAGAAPGDLDPSFNGTGTVVTPIATGYSQAKGVVRQTDGKLVVAGAALVPVQGNPDNLDFVVVRYDAAGALDPSFGGTGIVTTAVRGGDDQAEAVIQQTDGKIVAAGLSYDGTGFNDSTFTLVRYLDNGTLDPDFGGGTGKVTTAIGMGTYDGALALVQQTDGKLVVAGYSDTGIAVVRYDTSGNPDPAFNGTGIVTTSVGSSASANAIVEQATDHKLVVAGSSDASIVLVRYGTAGAPDVAFNGTGVVTTAVGSGNAVAHALVQQAADGKLVIAGVSNDGTHDQVTLVRYGLDGMVDTVGFGTSGVAATPVGTGDAVAFGLAEQADGKLVAAGSAKNATNTDFALVRYDTAGAPDGTFGTAGIVLTPIGTGNDAAAAIVYQPDGLLAVVGFATSTQMDVAAARYVGIEGLTTTTSTTGASTTTTSTTLPLVAFVPGGPPTKTSSDCYLELRIDGVDAATQVQKNQVVSCTDGDPCDTGPCGDGRCDLRVAACINQADPALPDCTPPAAGLDSVKVSKALTVNLVPPLTGAVCTPSVPVQVPIKLNKKGKYLAGKSKLVTKGKAKAPKGTSPRTDSDKWTIQCMPRTTACPE